MPDVIFLSSVFNDVKIAEPMGSCILTACLREKGFDVEILEPSIDGWGIERTVDEIAARQAPIVALSMLRDKHVEDVLKFVSLLRARCRDRFICVGGHGPSIAVDAIDLNYLPKGADRFPVTSLHDVSSSTYWKPHIAPVRVNDGPIVASRMVDRGKGAGIIHSEDEALNGSFNEVNALSADESAYFFSAPDEADSPYFDKSREYFRILKYIDTYMLGEADTNFPILVERILKGEPWQDIPGLAYLDGHNRLVRNPRPPKIDNLAAIPHMARDVLIKYHEKYGKSIPASILASRGCYYRCTFCSVVQYELLQVGSKHRQRPNEDIVDEIRELHEKYGVTHFNFEDDNFIVKNRLGIQKLHDLCDRFMALDFKVNFTFFCRADAVSEDLFRHFKEAGLVGIYFGMESVHPDDLEFFHKGTKVTDNFRALDILLSLGFSPRVDSQLRIMLGYITWHPLTSFESLRATSRFIQKYKAPPKLLRRKLRLYSATEVVKQVAELGLINPDHKDGWNFRDPRIEKLDRWIDNYAATVNKIRDKLRTLEKAGGQYGYPVATLEDIRAHRIIMDQALYQYFDEIVEIAAASPQGASSPTIAEFDVSKREAFNAFLTEQSIKELIADGYAACGFNKDAVDLFRK